MNLSSNKMILVFCLRQTKKRGRDEKEGANEREPKSSQVGAVWAYEKTSHGGWLVCWC